MEELIGRMSSSAWCGRSLGKGEIMFISSPTFTLEKRHRIALMLLRILEVTPSSDQSRMGGGIMSNKKDKEKKDKEKKEKEAMLATTTALAAS